MNIGGRLTYLPFIGWLVSLAANHDTQDGFLLHHIKQAFAAAALFTAVLIVLGVILTFAGHGSWPFRLAVVILIYLLYVLYSVAAVIGTKALLTGKEIKLFPWGKYAERLKL